MPNRASVLLCFFFNDTATTEIYTLSLHDALPICWCVPTANGSRNSAAPTSGPATTSTSDRKSTRLKSSHVEISYAVFCLKKKNGGIVALFLRGMPCSISAGVGFIALFGIAVLIFLILPATTKISPLSLHALLPI